MENWISDQKFDFSFRILCRYIQITYHFLLLFLDFLLIFSHYSFSLSSSFFVLFLEIYIDIRFMFIVATIYLFSTLLKKHWRWDQKRKRGRIYRNKLRWFDWFRDYNITLRFGLPVCMFFTDAVVLPRVASSPFYSWRIRSKSKKKYI